jgi:hypothetical protein
MRNESSKLILHAFRRNLKKDHQFPHVRSSVNITPKLKGVPLNVELATTESRSSSERTAGKWVSHSAEHSRRMPVGGFRVTWDTAYLTDFDETWYVDYI